MCFAGWRFDQNPRRTSLFLFRFQKSETMKLIIFLTQLFFLCKQSVQKQLQIDEKTALIIIDVQNCFLKGGSLAVEGGNEIIPLINQLREKFETVILTQDWHCEKHISFASVHPG